MTQEKKKSLQVLLVGTSATVAVWIVWLVTIMQPDPKAFGAGMMLLLPLIAITLVISSAAIADIKFLLNKDEEKKD